MSPYKCITNAADTAFLSQGMCLSIIGPTMYDLTRQNHLNYEQLSRAASAWSLGILIGSPLGATSADRLIRWSDHVLVVLLLADGLAISSVPFTPNLPLLALLWATQGLVFGATNVCEQLWISLGRINWGID